MPLEPQGAMPWLCLGTAMWGWKLNEDQVFALADAFYELGGRWFDTAANYPISKDPAAKGAAATILGRWLRARRPPDVSVIYKVGSVANDGGPGCDLSSPYLARQCDEALTLLGTHPSVVAVHWDNRDDPGAILETHSFMRDRNSAGFGIGFSGVRHPDLYAELSPDLSPKWVIQVKSNPSENFDYERYRAFHGARRFLAYGLRGGGFRSDQNYDEGSTAALRGGTKLTAEAASRAVDLVLKAGIPVSTWGEASLAIAAANPDVTGIIIGPTEMPHIRSDFAALRQWTRRRMQGLWRSMGRRGDGA